MVCIDHPEAGPLAQRIATRLYDYAFQHAAKGLPSEWPLHEAIDLARAGGKFPALIVEPADNIGGGSPGDATWVLKAFLEREVKRAGLILAAPGVVEQLRDVGPGSERRLILGGHHPALSGPPVTLDTKVIRHSDGEFDLEDPQSHLAAARGTRIRMGRSVLVESQGLLILLTTLPTAPMDLGQWRCVGVNPEEFHLIAIKAAVAHRRAYDPIARSSYTVGTPGPCSSDLASFPYRNLRRPMFPLDEICTAPTPFSP
jgi:microcystin degradation protein MlrC